MPAGDHWVLALNADFDMNGRVPVDLVYDTIRFENESDSLALYAGREEIARSRGEPLHVTRALPGDAPDLYVAIARNGKKIAGIRTIGLAQKVGEIE